MTSLNPTTITQSTFSTLLSHYPQTVRAVHISKARTKFSKPSKSKSKSKPALSEDIEELIQKEVEEFIELDEWRYTGLPGELEEGGEGKGGERGLPKDDVVKLMEWKLKHGINRPALLGMIKSNPEPLIRHTTSAAFTTLPTPPTPTPESTLPSEALEEVSKLRGVGVATASLILSIAAAAEVPFYSDDVYLWLVLDIYPGGKSQGGKEVKVKPNGEIKAKYDIKEYAELYQAVQNLRSRLEGVSCADIERVAFVIRHLDLSESGYPGPAPLGSNSEKRRHEDEDDETTTTEEVKKKKV